MLNDTGVSFRFILLVAQFVILRVEPFLVLCHFKINSGGKLGELIFIRDFFFDSPENLRRFRFKRFEKEPKLDHFRRDVIDPKKRRNLTSLTFKTFSTIELSTSFRPGPRNESFGGLTWPGQLVSTAT